MRLVVLHRGYGCDTGCCGHVIEDEAGNQRGGFQFDHPRTAEDFRSYAEAMIRHVMGDEHVKDLDWDGCEISDD